MDKDKRRIQELIERLRKIVAEPGQSGECIRQLSAAINDLEQLVCKEQL